MKTKIVKLNNGSCGKKPPICNKQFFELVDYLYSLKDKKFSGRVEINLEEGVVDRVAFNQVGLRKFGKSVNG